MLITFVCYFYTHDILKLKRTKRRQFGHISVGIRPRLFMQNIVKRLFCIYWVILVGYAADQQMNWSDITSFYAIGFQVFASYVLFTSFQRFWLKSPFQLPSNMVRYVVKHHIVSLSWLKCATYSYIVALLRHTGFGHQYYSVDISWFVSSRQR